MKSFEYFDFTIKILLEFFVELAEVDRLDGDKRSGNLQQRELAMTMFGIPEMMMRSHRRLIGTWLFTQAMLVLANPRTYLVIASEDSSKAPFTYFVTTYEGSNVSITRPRPPR